MRKGLTTKSKKQGRDKVVKGTLSKLLFCERRIS